MKTKLLKTLGIIACAVLLIGGSIAGTYAYLTSKATTKNVFTVGNVTISLDEANVNELGQKENEDRVTPAGDYSYEFKLIPGREYNTNPTIEVGADSETCWLFVEIEYGIAGILDITNLEAQLNAKGWAKLGNSDVYYYTNGAVAKETRVPVFDYFKILGSATSETIAACGDDKSIAITAYAIQADGFATAEAAWTAASGEFNG